MWENEKESGLATKDKIKTKTPSDYRVIMHNDDYTTMDFVVSVLMIVFNKPAVEATQIMLDVHKKGAGICGIFTKEIAETKIELTHQRAKESGYPLHCSMEKV
jgi:ATP-dependent Clp protease adaptor protein ClpS